MSIAQNGPGFAAGFTKFECALTVERRALLLITLILKLKLPAYGCYRILGNPAGKKIGH